MSRIGSFYLKYLVRFASYNSNCDSSNSDSSDNSNSDSSNSDIFLVKTT